ncbi:MAG: hypothetical protein KHZ15_08780 [Coprobacillus cateniformis]|uniref:hypothetical protein n=1 Tax=Longibaculum muris TaxID=1796628 RepID=UPI003AB4E5AC|nr:hypothetical protein [Coprobacillus cateniformis]
MKKILLMLMMIGVILTGCSTSKSADEMKILTPNGAPALSLVGVYEDVTKNGKINIVEGSDLVSSELMKADSEYDAIVAPINLGCQLLAKGKTDYKLAGVLTWGNLYLVENEGVQNNELAAFGEQAVPGMIFKLVKDSNDVMKNAKVTYYNAVSDVQAQVLAGKVQYALMAEPAATATIAKAKQNVKTIKNIASLQELYQKQTNSKQAGYPQAAIFVKNKEDVKELLVKLDEFTNKEAVKEDNNIEELVNKIGAETFGVPNAAIAAKTWKNQNIHYQEAPAVKDDIQSILKTFHIEYNDDMLVK